MSHTNAKQQVGQKRCANDAVGEAAELRWARLERLLEGLFVVLVEVLNRTSLQRHSPGPNALDVRLIAANPASLKLLQCRTSEVRHQWLCQCLPFSGLRQTGLNSNRCGGQKHFIESEIRNRKGLALQTIADPNNCAIALIPARLTPQIFQTQTVSVRLIPMQNSQGSIGAILGWCRDISEGEPAPEAPDSNGASLLQNITLAIAEAEDFHTALSLALRQVCETADWDYGEAWYCKSEGGCLYCSPAWYGSPTPALERFRHHSENLTFLPGIGLPGRVWLQKQAEWAQDASQLPEAIFHRARLAQQAGIKAALGVPILAQDRILAVLAFFMFQSRPADRQMVELVSDIAARVGVAIAQKQAAEALRQAEAKYRQIFDNALEGIFQSTPDGGYLLVNSTLSRIYGYNCPTEVMNAIRDIQHQLYVDPNRRSQFQRLLQEHHAVWDFQSQCYRKDGSIIWVSENARTIRNAKGEIIGYEGTVKDITERKRAEERFAALVQNSSDTIAILAPDGTIIYGSPSLERILGYTPDRLLGQNLLDYVHPEDIATVTDALISPEGLNSAIASQAHSSPIPLHPIEYRFRHADGSWIYLESVSNDRREDPSIQGIVLNSRDITQRKQTEAQLHRRLAIEAALSKISRLFVSTHEPDFNKILALLGIAADAHRAYIFQFHDRGTRLSNTYEWCSSETQPQIHNRQHLHTADFPWFVQQLSNLEILDICDLEELPENARAEKTLFLAQNIRSSLLVPIYSHDRKLLGFLGFDDTEKTRTWSATEAQPLRVIAQMLSNYYQRKQAELALRQAESKYRSIFENAVEGIFQTTPDGRYLTANPMLAKIYGYESPEELIANLTDIEHQLYVDPERRSQFRRLLQEQEAVWGFESQIYRRDRSIIWISECARTIRNADGVSIGYEGTVVDITQRKQAETELHQRDNLLLGVAQAMNHLLTNDNYRKAALDALAILGNAAGVDRVYICELSDPPLVISDRSSEPTPPISSALDTLNSCAVCSLNLECQLSIQFQWTRNETVSCKHRACSIANVRSTVMGALLVGEPVSLVREEMNEPTQELFAGEGTLSSLMVPILVNNEFWGYIGFDDIQNERQWSKSEISILKAIAASIGGALHRNHQEEMIRHQAYHDRLTGLPNRQVLDERLPLAIQTAQQQGHQLAVMFLDLDRFKIINDTLGHAVGDRLLKTAARRLKNCLRESDTIVRWGGDEFILLLEQIHDSQNVAAIAQRLLESLQPPFEIDDNQLYISGSIGIAIYPQDGTDPETLIKNADIALYRVKEQGRNHYQIYTADMNSEGSELLLLDNYLHDALEREQFSIEYQPQIDLHAGTIAGMEALLRWQHPKLGQIPPTTFLPIAEENGAIVALGWWVLQNACTQNKAWQNAGLSPIRIVVNLSTRQFHHPDLVVKVAEILTETNLEPQWLGLEISETTAMHDPKLTGNILSQLKTLGVSTAIDDFGIGYASLNYLKEFAFDTIKLNQSFVADLPTNPKQAAIVSAIITLGEKLGMSVVAEGVETEAQRDFLIDLNCYEMQGYLFSPPVRPEDAMQLLESSEG